MKLLITGGAGFIGSHIAFHALKAGHEVVCVDDLSHGKKENVPQGARLIVEDVTKPAFGETLLKEKPEALSHHAAQIDVRKAVEDPIYDAQLNILGMLNVLEGAVAAKVRRVVFASSGGAIYGEQDVYPADETHKNAPLSPYGITKLTGEKYLDFYRNIHGLETVALRYSNVYGPRQDAHGDAGVVAIFCSCLIEGRQAKIFGTGEQTRDYVFVEDVAKANLLALSDSAKPGPFNIGTGRETSVNELYSTIANALDSTDKAELAPARPGEVERSSLLAALAEKELGWKPQYGLEEGIAKTVKWFKEHLTKS